MALMVGAFIIHGISPGPNVINEQPALFWGLIVSFWVGNFLLLLLNLPLIGLWVRMLAIPYKVLFPAIVAFACIGTFSIGLNALDIFAIAFFGVVGYFLVKFGAEPAPLLLGFVLGSLLEQNSASLADHLARGSDDLLRAPDLGRSADPCGGAARRRRPALDSAATR